MWVAKSALVTGCDACCHAVLLLLLQSAAEAVGKKVAELCAEKQISKVCFDRGGFTYHGRIQVRSQGRQQQGAGTG
jgi:hypothetical protein